MAESGDLCNASQVQSRLTHKFFGSGNLNGERESKWEKNWREGWKNFGDQEKAQTKILRFFVIYHKHLNKNIKLKNIFFLSFFFFWIKSHLVSSTPCIFFLCRFQSNLSLKFDHDRRSAKELNLSLRKIERYSICWYLLLPAVGTSCFGEVVILSSKAIKGVAGGGGAPPDSDWPWFELFWSWWWLFKSKIWSNSGGCSVSDSFGAGRRGAVCFNPESRSKSVPSFFLERIKNKLTNSLT